MVRNSKKYLTYTDLKKTTNLILKLLLAIHLKQFRKKYSFKVMLG
jgi:hypothetical protein